MLTGIDWWSVATVVMGSSIIGLGTIVWKQINKILLHTELFAKHIADCETRAHLMAEHRARNEQHRIETERRLNLLETAILLGQRINHMGEIK